MFGIRLFTLLSQTVLCLTAQAATHSNVPITLLEKGNISVANRVSVPINIPSNALSLYYARLGDPIPEAELRHALRVAQARVEDYLPQYADYPISQNTFDTNVSFQETGDYIYIHVYAYGFGLTWGQLSRVLVLLRTFMLGLGPNHPQPHFQQLDFYVQLTAGLDVARGAVEFTPGERAVTKRNLVIPTHQLPHANFSLPGTPPTLPIMFHVSANLDLNITSLGLPIPQVVIIDTIESAFSEVAIEHTDIDAPIPFNRPYSFNDTSGKWPHPYKTEIRISSYPRKRISWGVLLLVLYGLRDFMGEVHYFSEIHFGIIDGKHGTVGHGDVHYSPVSKTASTE